MENFSAAILSNSATDVPADRLQWLHIMNFFLPLTPSAPWAICATQRPASAKGKAELCGFQRKELISLKIWSPESKLGWRCPASTELSYSKPPSAHSALSRDVQKPPAEDKQTSWHSDFQLQDHNHQSLG